MNSKIRLAMVAISAAFPVVAGAADGAFSGGIESFRWQEFDAGGARLVKESGPRFFFGADVRTPLGRASSVYLDAGGRAYIGDEDYDGQACNILTGSCVPLKSDTFYIGALAEALFRWTFRSAPGFELFGGGGLDNWLREIDDTATAVGGSEYWTAFYLKAGAGYRATAKSSPRFDVGLKYPFYAFNDTDTGVALEPRGRASAFARASIGLGSSPGSRWHIGAYYDSYRFAESDHEFLLSVIGIIEVWQPESEQDVIGVEVGRSWR
jgi:hypothetical protein